VEVSKLQRSFTWYSSFSWLTVIWESLRHFTFRALISLANSRPTTKASHSAWLFEALNSKCKDCSILMCLGPSRTIPTPLPIFFVAKSTYSVHHSSIVWLSSNFEIKSAKLWDLIGHQGSYLISNYSTDHAIILLVNSSFLSTLLIEQSVLTIIT